MSVQMTPDIKLLGEIAINIFGASLEKFTGEREGGRGPFVPLSQKAKDYKAKHASSEHNKPGTTPRPAPRDLEANLATELVQFTNAVMEKVEATGGITKGDLVKMYMGDKGGAIVKPPMDGEPAKMWFMGKFMTLEEMETLEMIFFDLLA